METFPPSNLKKLQIEPVNYWSVFHDGYLNEITSDFNQRTLLLDIAMGYPDPQGDCLKILFSGLTSVYSAIWMHPEQAENNYELITYSISVNEFRDVIHRDRDQFASIFDANIAVGEAGVSIQFDVAGGFVVNAVSWQWELNGDKIEPAEMLVYGNSKWDTWSNRAKK